MEYCIQFFKEDSMTVRKTKSPEKVDGCIINIYTFTFKKFK